MPSPFRAGSRYPLWPCSPRCQARSGQVRGIPTGTGAVSPRTAETADLQAVRHVPGEPEWNRVWPWSPRCQARSGQVRGIPRDGGDRRPPGGMLVSRGFCKSLETIRPRAVRVSPPVGRRPSAPRPSRMLLDEPADELGLGWVHVDEAAAEDAVTADPALLPQPEEGSNPGSNPCPSQTQPASRNVLISCLLTGVDGQCASFIGGERRQAPCPDPNPRDRDCHRRSHTPTSASWAPGSSHHTGHSAPGS